MASQVYEVNLQTRTARRRLKARPTPYWRGLDEGRHLGYFKGIKSAKWVARMRVPSDQGPVYLTYRLAFCDDVEEADGDRILNWSQAKQKAEKWFATQTRVGSKSRVSPRAIKIEDPSAGLSGLTIKDAVDGYVSMRDARQKARVGRESKSDAHRLKRHVLKRSGLGQLKLEAISEDDLRSWIDGLVGMKSSTRQRLINDFRAALNQIHRRHRKVLPKDFPIIIKHGLGMSAEPDNETDPSVRDNQILSDDQVTKLIAAALSLDPDGDAARMVILLAATGARFSQLQRMLVRDV
ncbi:MAG: hypothetical protein ACTHM0_01070 [Sphingomonas sp.]